MFETYMYLMTKTGFGSGLLIWVVTAVFTIMLIKAHRQDHKMEKQPKEITFQEFVELFRQQHGHKMRSGSEYVKALYNSMQLSIEEKEVIITDIDKVMRTPGMRW